MNSFNLFGNKVFRHVLVMLLFLGSFNEVFGQGVTYNLLGTGSGVSADKAIGGSEEDFYGLAPLNIGQSTNSTNGFTPNVTNYKFKFSISPYWRFKPGVAIIEVSSHFTEASISVSETEVEVIYSTSADMKGASMKIDSLKVQSLNPRNMVDDEITYVQVNPISGIDNGAKIGNLKQIAGKVRKLMVLLPGETYSQEPLVATGKVGTPIEQIVGKSFEVEVRTVDQFFNVATHEQDGNSNSVAIGHEISFSSSDKKIVVENINLTEGIGVGTAIMMNVGTHQITAIDVTRPGVESVISTDFNVVKKPFSKLLLTLPGETYSFESFTGKVGVANPQNAGATFSATVYATDQYWVIDETVNGQVQLAHEDAFGSAPITVNFVNGVATISGIQFNTSGDFVISSNYLSGTGVSTGTSNVRIEETAYDKIVAVLPYQEYVPGSVTGVSEEAIIPERGTVFNVRIIAADVNSNKVSTINNTLSFISSDPSASFVSSATFVNGEYILSLNLNSPGEQTLTITDPVDNKSTVVTIGNPTPATDPAGYFRSRKSGNWEDATVWENSTDEIEWYSSTLAPDEGATSVLIRTGNQVSTLNDYYFPSTEVVIETNAILNTSIDKYFGSNKIKVSGKVIDYGVSFLADSLIFKNNSIYDNKSSDPLLPNGLWENGSNCTITGNLTVNILSLANQDFYNFTYEPIGQTSNVVLNDFIGVRNDFVINSTGGKNLILYSSNTPATFTKDISVKNYIQNGGTVELFNTTPSLPTRILNLKISESFVFNKGILTKVSGASIGKIQISSLAPNVVIGAEAYFGSNVAVEFTHSDAIIDLKSYEFKGSTGTFTVGENSTVKTSHSQGLNLTGSLGNVQFTGNRTFPSTATIEYYGTAMQNTGNVITGNMATSSKILVNNTNGVVYNGSVDFSGVTSTNVIINEGCFLDIQSKTYTGTQFGGDGELRLAGDIPTLTWTNGTIHANGTSAQSIPASTYYNLKVSNEVVTLGGDIVIGNNFNISNDYPVIVNTGTHKVTYDKAGDQQIAGINYYNLDVLGSGTKTIVAPAEVSKVLIVSGATLDANSNLTLTSNGAVHANVAPLEGGGTIIGNANVQVYINGGGTRGTRMLSSPIADESQVFSQLIANTIIVAGTEPSTGLDVSPSVQFAKPGISFYKEDAVATEAPYTYINDIHTAVPKGQGFFLYYIGNRNGIDEPGKIIRDFAPLTDASTVTYTGVLNKGNVTINLPYTASASDQDGLFVAGNPYAATIDWGKVYTNNSANVGPTIKIVKTGQAVSTYNAVADIGTNEAIRYIKPGQGFYVQALGIDKSLTFMEAHKEVSVSNGNSLMRAGKETVELVTLSGKKVAQARVNSSVLQNNRRMLKMSLSNSSGVEDEAAIVMSSLFNDAADNLDSRYVNLQTSAVSLTSYSSDKQKMTINLLGALNERKEIPLDVTATASGLMKFKLKELENLNDFRIFVKDNFTTTQTELLNENSEYEFTIDKTQSASFGSERLSLVFLPPSTLAIEESSFKVEKNNQNIVVTWKPATAKDVVNYVVEKASDDKLFTAIETVYAGQKFYTVTDKQPLNGYNYYRIKSVYADGTYSYSSTKAIHFGVSGLSLNLYPNPSKDYINLDFGLKDNKAVAIAIYNVLGTPIKQVLGNTNSLNTIDVQTLTKGVYFVEIKDFVTKKIIKRLKFIKD